jgi:uroporphyrin-III C-methyltransferase
MSFFLFFYCTFQSLALRIPSGALPHSTPLQFDNPTMSHISLLTSIDSTGHVHLIIGSNPLAAARCSKSLEVGAKPLLIAPETADLHYALQKRIDNGEVKWLKKSFDDGDVLRLGREEINGVVDAVFVTSGPRDPSSMEDPLLHSSS